MGVSKRVAVSVIGVVVATVTLAGCGGLKGKIQDFDSVSVWPKADPRGQEPKATLSTLAPVTVKCYDAGKVDANGMGYGPTYKISYDGGSGYIDASTSILSDKGEVIPSMVSKC